MSRWLEFYAERAREAQREMDALGVGRTADPREQEIARLLAVLEAIAADGEMDRQALARAALEAGKPKPGRRSKA
jgi:hypothetical protein